MRQAGAFSSVAIFLALASVPAPTAQGHIIVIGGAGNIGDPEMKALAESLGYIERARVVHGDGSGEHPGVHI